jgi:hypothetical protein
MVGSSWALGVVITHRSERPEVRHTRWTHLSSFGFGLGTRRSRLCPDMRSARQPVRSTIALWDEVRGERDELLSRLSPRLADRIWRRLSTYSYRGGV